MGIYIELTVEEEARLREQANRRGEPVETVASELLRSLLFPVVTAPFAPVVDEAGVFREERWNEVLRSITARSGSTPVLSSEVLTREAMYSDHD